MKELGGALRNPPPARKDGPVPRYADQSELPADIEALVPGIGANRARLAVVLDLAANPDSTRSQISGRTGLRMHTAYEHLLALETAGLVSADVPAEDRHGKTPRYRLDSAALKAALAALGGLLD